MSREQKQEKGDKEMTEEKQNEIVRRCKATDKRMEEVRLRAIEEGLCSLNAKWFRAIAVLIKRDLDAIENILSTKESQLMKRREVKISPEGQRRLDSLSHTRRQANKER